MGKIIMLDHGGILNPWRDALQLAGYNAVSYQEPADALNNFSPQDVSAIIVNDVVGTWHEVPSDVDIKEPTGIACYYIGELRKRSKDTPILVLHMGTYVLPNKSTDCFTKAGATACIDKQKLQKPWDLEKILKVYVNTPSVA